MERITNIQTIEHEDGSSHDQLYCFGHLWGSAYFKKGNKDYEEYIAIVKRLAEYEDLEEQGKLLKLPCAVGDMTYNANKLFRKVVDDVVKRIEVDTDGFWVITSSGGVYSFDDFGKTVFTTRQQAEEISLGGLRREREYGE